MTTTVTVHAHCADNIKVKITKTGEPDVYLTDGETYENIVHDELDINVREVADDTGATTQGSTQTPPKKTEE